VDGNEAVVAAEAHAGNTAVVKGNVVNRCSCNAAGRPAGPGARSSPVGGSGARRGGRRRWIRCYGSRLPRDGGPGSRSGQRRTGRRGAWLRDGSGDVRANTGPRPGPRAGSRGSGRGGGLLGRACRGCGLGLGSGCEGRSRSLSRCRRAGSGEGAGFLCRKWGARPQPQRKQQAEGGRRRRSCPATLAGLHDCAALPAPVRPVSQRYGGGSRAGPRARCQFGCSSVTEWLRPRPAGMGARTWGEKADASGNREVAGGVC
jgi:hypothetical protein